MERVLKPGGILAAWGYQLLYTGTELDSVIEHFHSQVVGPYWPPERALLDNGYTRIHFPYPRVPTQEVFMQATWQFSHLIGYLNTWSAVKQYQKAQGQNPIEIHWETLAKAWDLDGVWKEQERSLKALQKANKVWAEALIKAADLQLALINLRWY